MLGGLHKIWTDSKLHIHFLICRTDSTVDILAAPTARTQYEDPTATVPVHTWKEMDKKTHWFSASLQVFLQLQNPAAVLCRPLCFRCTLFLCVLTVPFSVAQHLSTQKPTTASATLQGSVLKGGFFKSLVSPAKWPGFCKDSFMKLVSHLLQVPLNRTCTRTSGKSVFPARNICPWAIVFPGQREEPLSARRCQGSPGDSSQKPKAGVCTTN